MNTADMKRVETHLKRTFNTGGIILKPRGKPNDSCEVYVGDEFIGVVFEDEDEAGTTEHVLLVAELTLMATGKTIFFMESFAEHGDISHWLANEVAPALGQVH